MARKAILKDYFISLTDKTVAANEDRTIIIDSEDGDKLKKSPLKRTEVEGIVTKEAAFNLDAGDAGKLIRVDMGVDTDCTIRENATHEIPVNSVFTLTQAGAGAINLVAGGATVINAIGESKTGGQHAGIKLIKVGTDLWDTFKYE